MARPEHLGTRPRMTGLILLVTGQFLAAHIVLMLCGCGSSETGDANKGDAKPVDSQGTSSQSTAVELVKKMVAVYRNATSYRDQGRLTLTTRAIAIRALTTRGSKPRDQLVTLDCSVTWVRKNRFRIHVRGTQIVSDGQSLWARLPKGAIARGQVLQRSAPKALSMASLDMPSGFSLNETSLLADALAGGFGGEPFQLQLLSTDGTIEPLLSAKQITLLTAQEIHGRKCDGLEFQSDTRTRIVLWIDQQQSILRRIVFPETLTRRGDDQLVHSLVADFHGATLNGPVDDREFNFPVKANERRVKQFVPTPPEVPLHLLGKPIKNLALVGPDGKTTDASSLAGNVSVLVFFGCDDPNSLAALPQLMAVASRSQAAEKIALMAVSTDPKSLANEQLQQIVGPLLYGGKLYRAPHIRTNNRLGIKTLPTTLVLNAQGVVEYLQPSFFENAPQLLGEAINKIASGKSLHQETRARFDSEQKEYQDMLNGASVILEKR